MKSYSLSTFRKKKNKIFLSFMTILGMFVLAGGAYAINTIVTGWQVGPNTTTTIDVTSIGGDCKKVVTANNGKTYFVPTKTVAEWNTFKAAAPSLSMTLNSCAVNCSYTTYEWWSCSASCAGGNYDTYYTKTVVESGGGTCPISEGQFAGWDGSACNTQACPVDCVGSWGSCSATCGGGTQTYTITTPASGGGAACPANNGATQSCNTQWCPWHWVLWSGPYDFNFGPICSANVGDPCLNSIPWSGISCTIWTAPRRYNHDCSWPVNGAVDINGSACANNSMLWYSDTYYCQ